MLQIGIADDHEIVRNGLEMIIERQGMKVALSASSFQSLTDALHQQNIDILILDLNLGDMNGLESVIQVKKEYPNLPILVLSAYPEEVYAVRAFKAGAMGYLNKSIITEELINAIEAIKRGRRYVTKTLEENLEFGLSLDQEKESLVSKLSSREFEVLTLIAEGLTFQEIAQKLDVSPKTVSTYRTRMLEKLHLKTSAQLMQFAYEIQHKGK